MPLFFALAGLLLVVTGVNGTTKEAGELLKRDFTGPNNFIVWLFALLAAGALGYIPKFKPISYGFLALVFIGILLTSGSGVFDRLREVMQEFGSGGVGNGGDGVSQDNPLVSVDFDAGSNTSELWNLVDFTGNF